MGHVGGKLPAAALRGGLFCHVKGQQHRSCRSTVKDAVVNGVRGFLYEMFYNLIDNAIKYNIDGGKVEVTVLTGDTAATMRCVHSGR